MPRFDLLLRLVVVVSLLISSFPPATVLAQPGERPAYQTVEPPPTETATPLPSDTATPLPSDTATPLPSDMATPLPSDTATPLPSDTATPLPGETATPSPTETAVVLPSDTATPGVTDTATATPPLTVTLTLTPTETATFTPTVELTPTATPAPLVSLALNIEPAPVQAGQLVTVTLTLSNPGQLALDSPVLSTTLPLELGYDIPLGAVTPGYNPIARLLTWALPPDLTTQPEVRLGFVGRVAADTPATSLTLLAELTSPNLAAPVQAQAGLTITPAPPPPSLGISAEPGFVQAGELVTVTLTLSNPSQIAVDNLVLSSTLPLELSYDTPLGAVVPGYNPITRLLTWAVPVELTSQPVLTVGWVSRVAAEAPGSALSLAAEAIPLGLQAQSGLIILAALAVTPTPIVAGPPAQIQLGVEPIRDKAGQGQGEREQWLAVYVSDADGLAVADGTEVRLELSQGKLDQSVVQTKAGLATTRFKAPPGQTVSLTAYAGTAQGSLVWPEGNANLAAPLDLKAQDERYGAEAMAKLKARNALRAEGLNLAADNPTRRVEFSPTSLTFRLKQPDDDLKGEKPGVPADEQLALSFQLTEVRVGQQSLLTGAAQRGAGGNWVTYQTPGQPWQLAYEVAEASVEQYFIFEKGTPTEGDLVIEGRFETQLKASLLSNDEGIRFAVDKKAELGELGYGPAVVSDAQGRQFIAPLELQNKKLKITIPAAWLALAEFPVVVDPLIGPASLVSGLTGGVSYSAVASDGNNFLSVWPWQGDIYAQLTDSTGTLSGSLLTVSQAAGVQEPSDDVIYNPASGEYLVVWVDHRYGFTYHSLAGQRLSASGQPVGGELEFLPPTKNANYANLAVSVAGNYLLVWSDQSGSSLDVYGQMLTSGGVLSGPRLTLSNVANDQVYPAVAYDSQANVFEVVWSDRRDGSSYDIYGQQVTVSGVISGSNRQLAGSGDSANLTWPRIASNGSSQFLATWQREVSSSDHNVHALRVSAATGQAVGSVLNIDTAAGKENSPAVTGTAGGEVLLLWRDDGVIEAQRVAGNGSLLGSVLTLSEASSGIRKEPAVAHGSGQSLGVWSDTSQSGQYSLTGRRVADNGSLSGAEIFISPYYSRREWTALAPSPTSSESLLAWQQAAAAPTTDIFIQRVDSQGQALGNPLNVTNQAAAQEYPALAAGSQGYLAVWRDARNAASGLDIYGQLLTASATPTGSLIAISTATNVQSNPAVAYNSQLNNYLVVWDDNRAGNNRDIYGQVVNANGTLGGGFNLSVTNTQGYPEVAYNPDQNRYLVVWEDKRSGSTEDIYGQVISADGSLVGSSFAMAAAANNQYDPVVAYHQASQSYLVAWWDNRNGNYDIYGQVVSGTGVLSGSNFAISNPGGTSNDQEWPDMAALAGATPAQFLVVWQDRRASTNRDIYAQRVSTAGLLLDETDTLTDETNPANNFVIDNSSDYTERPAVAYNGSAAVALAAWNNRDDGGVYLRRYTPATPPLPGASFTAAPLSGVVPLTVTFSDTSTGTIASRIWSFGNGTPPYSPPFTGGTGGVFSYTYLTTGTFTAVLTVTNPGGSASASRLITVTEQTTPSLSADFEGFDLGADPTFWVDQNGSTGMVNDFSVLWTGQSRALGTTQTVNSSRHALYAIPGWAAWQNYDYSGRMVITATGGEVGLSFYSRNPAGDPKRYSLHNIWGTLSLNATNTTLQGEVDTGVIPQANTWYRFRVRAETLADRVTFRVKVWPDGQAEPTLWQAEAYDNSPSRATAGAVGVRTWGPGYKYFDDLTVTPLSGVTADFSAFPQTGAAPLLVQFLNTSSGADSYLWNLGDTLTSTQFGPTHTYATAGIYTVTLTASNGASSATLTKTNYITVSPAAERAWRLITTTLSPPINGEMGMAYDSARNRTVLYGGNGTGWPYSNATWEFDGTDWLTITTVTGPTARYGATMAYLPPAGGGAGEGIILFGGSDSSDTALNQTWRYTNSTWSQVTVTGSVPPSRTYASLVFASSPPGLYLFGGNNGTTYFNDLWRYDNGTWANITPATNPPARTLSAMTYASSPPRLLLFGGRSLTGTILSDFWAFDLATSTWTQLSTSGGPPPGRLAHTLTYDSATGKVVLAGGTPDNGDTLLGDTWHYTPPSPPLEGGWSQAAPTTPLPPAAYHGAVYGGNAIILFSNGETWKYE